MAIIFDLDGTLLNTLTDLADAGNFALRMQGLDEFPEDDLKLLVGNGIRLLTDRMSAIAWSKWSPERQAHYLSLTAAADEEFEGFSAGMLSVSYAAAYQDWREQEVPAELANAVYRDFMEYYAQHSTDQTKPYPGILEMLGTLKQDGIQMAVISNKADHLAQAVVKNYFGEDLFAAVTGMKPDVAPKPDPSGALLLASQLQVKPSEMLMVGDAMTDMQTAVNAGMTGIGVTWGFRTEQELVDSGASLIVHSPAELLEKLRNLKNLSV